MSAPTPQYAPLRKAVEADVCVVGAGIAGLTTAYLLTRARQRVVVVDDGEIGSGETRRTTAHLTCALDDRYSVLERRHGERGARLAAESHARAIDRIEAIVATERIRCDFARVDGYLFAPPDASTTILDRELAAVHRAGLSDVTMVERAPLGRFATGPALRFPRQAQFHPIRYLASLAEAVTRDGGRIFTRSHAEAIEDGTPASVRVRGGHIIRAGAVVVATNSPVNDVVTMHTKQAAYRTYVVAARVPAADVPLALFWDTADPYHYVRLAGGGRNGADALLIVGGEDHKTGQADDEPERFGRLEAWARERVPTLGAIDFRWSGQVMEPIDGLAFIGRNPTGERNVYIATGDSGNGMTHGTIAGMLLSDLILGRDNAWATLYDPGRVTLSAALPFAQENLNVAAQYADLLTPGEVASTDAIAPGAGAVVRRGLTKVAVYRDEAGALHERSALCPHLGCVVDWNRAERSWDCPCHGSRFDCYGRVLNGPAISDLAASDDGPPRRST